MANFVMGIISLTIGVVILANVFISTVKGTNQSFSCYNTTNTTTVCDSWSSAEVALWGLLTIIAIAGLVYGILNVFGMT